MKTKLLLPGLLMCAAGIAAQPKPKKQPVTAEKPQVAVPPATILEPPAETLKERFEIHTSFVQGRKLAGYNDPRYVADDKTDYLKSDAMTANLEFAVKLPYRVRGNPDKMSSLDDFFHGTDFLRFGGQITGWTTLQGSSILIPKLGAPVNSSESVSLSLASLTRPGIGFFVGFGKKDLEVDIGINLSANIRCEGSRTRRVFDANGNAVLDGSGNVVTEQVDGRGCSPDAVFALPTLKFSWGSRGNLQYFITAGREMFEFQKDYLQTYFRIPLFSFLRMDIGVGLFPNATLFLQPNFDIGPITIGLRGGISLNYYESELRRVALADAAYFGASLSGRF